MYPDSMTERTDHWKWVGCVCAGGSDHILMFDGGQITVSLSFHICEIKDLVDMTFAFYFSSFVIL